MRIRTRDVLGDAQSSNEGCAGTRHTDDAAYTGGQLLDVDAGMCRSAEFGNLPILARGGINSLDASGAVVMLRRALIGEGRPQ